MTGFFAVRRAAVNLDMLRPQGFKILLDILVRQRLTVVEVPFTFAARHEGESKASFREGFRFIRQLGRLRLATWWSIVAKAEVGAFACVGVANLILDVALFNAVLHAMPHDPAIAKAISAGTAMVTSYFMNRHWTWRHHRRAGVNRELPLFVALSLVALLVAETCLWVSHYALGFTSALADNISANGVGLALGMIWRYWSFKRWIFSSPPPLLEPPSMIPAALIAQPSRSVELDLTDPSDEIVDSLAY
jgi:putative flippase GtrA